MLGLKGIALKCTAVTAFFDLNGEGVREQMQYASGGVGKVKSFWK